MSLIWTHLSMFSHLPLFCVACKYKWIFGVMMGIVKSWKYDPFIFASCMQLGPDILLHATLDHFSTWLFCTQITSFWLNAFRSKKVLDPKRRDPSLNLKTLHIIIWVTDMYRWFDALKCKQWTNLYLHANMSRYTCMQAYLEGNQKPCNLTFRRSQLFKTLVGLKIINKIFFQ